MSQDFIEKIVWKVVKLLAGKVKNSFRKKSKTSDTKEIAEKKIKCKKSKLQNSKEDIHCNSKVESSKFDNTSENTAENQTNEISKEVQMDSKLLEIKSKDDTKSNSADKKDNNEIENLNKNEIIKDSEVKSEEKLDDTKEEISWLNELLQHDEFFFHFTLFLFWAMVAGLNIPSVLTWAHNFKYFKSLQPDPSFLSGFILSICSLPLWQFELPNVNR